MLIFKLSQACCVVVAYVFLKSFCIVLRAYWAKKGFKFIQGAKLGFVTFVSHDVCMSKKWHELLWLGSHFTIVNGFAIKVQWSSPSRVKLPRFRKHYLTAKVFPKVPSKIQAIVTKKNGLRKSKHFKYLQASEASFSHEYPSEARMLVE